MLRENGADHSGSPDIMEVMSKPPSRRFPVTVAQLPVTRCQICQRTVAYRPGNLTEVLTGHYRRGHPEALGLTSREPAAETPGSGTDFVVGDGL